MEKDDPLLSESNLIAYSSYSSFLTNDYKDGNRAKYFAVTGTCFKLIGMQRKRYFKPGITTNLESRLRQYNCNRPQDDMCYYAFIQKVHNAKLTEDRLKYYLSAFQQKNKHKKKLDETVFIPYGELLKLVKLACDNFNAEMLQMNEIVDSFRNTIMEEAIIPTRINI